MGSWIVDADRKPGVLWVEVKDTLAPEEMRSLVAAHDTAIDAFAGRAYVVFCDLREMKVLSPEAAAGFEQAKAYSSAQPNFRGSAVLVSSTVVGMQHRRTSVNGGVMDTELIGADEAVLWDHLAALLSPQPA
jgi:hypothetical protein